MCCHDNVITCTNPNRQYIAVQILLSLMGDADPAPTVYFSSSGFSSGLVVTGAGPAAAAAAAAAAASACCTAAAVAAAAAAAVVPASLAPSAAAPSSGSWKFFTCTAAAAAAAAGHEACRQAGRQLLVSLLGCTLRAVWGCCMGLSSQWACQLCCTMASMHI